MNSEQNKIALKLALTTPCWKLISMYKECKADPKKFMESHPNLYLQENFDDNNGGIKWLKITGGVLVLAVIISLVLFIWAVILLVKYGRTMPTWALVLGIILLLFGGAIFTIILAYVTRGMKKN
jgi:hypothetical protein